jgi:hypothetical protein
MGRVSVDVLQYLCMLHAILGQPCKRQKMYRKAISGEGKLSLERGFLKTLKDDREDHAHVV